MNVKLIFIVLIIGLVYSSEVPEFEEEKGVMDLTADNFDAVVNHFEHVLVMFYAPWCGHCKKLHPEFEKSAAQLLVDGSEIKLAHVDATVHKELAQRFKVQGYPTLKFFIGGNEIEYNGPREADGITKWVMKKTLPSTSVLADVESIEKAKTDNQVVVLFFGQEDSEEFVVFSGISKQEDDLVFHHVTDVELASANGVNGVGLVLFKQFDEGRADFTGDWTNVEEVHEWVSTYSLETIMEFDQKAAGIIFGQGKTGLFLFIDEGEEDSDSALLALKEASMTLKGQVLMSTSGASEGLGQRLAEYIGVTPAMVPCVRLVSAKGGDLAKFQLDGDVTAKNILAFWNDYQEGKLQQHLKSEPVPETQEGPVTVLVGLSWNDVVLDESQDVLVEYYAPWCGHCKKLAPLYDELATMLSVVDNLVIAKMDSTANEVADLAIQGFPTLKFYPANNKAPVDFGGARDVDGMLTFLRESTSAVVNWDQLDNATDEVLEEVVEEEVLEEVVEAVVKDDL